MTNATFPITDRWRLSDDGEAQWVLEKYTGKSWRGKAWCGTKAGLLEVALPKYNVAAPNTVLATLSRLPNSYEPGALERVAIERLIDIPRWQMRPDFFPAPETQEAAE